MPALFILFRSLLLITVVPMLRKVGQDVSPDLVSHPLALQLRLPCSFPDRNLGQVNYRVANVSTGSGRMVVAVIVSGLLGIGSAISQVPAMDSATRLSFKVSTAMSNFITGVTAVSAGMYFWHREVLPLVVAPVACLALVTVYE